MNEAKVIEIYEQVAIGAITPYEARKKFMALFTSHTEDIEGKVKELKKQGEETQSPCPDHRVGCLVYHVGEYLTKENKGFNQCLDEVLKILRKGRI